MWLCVEADDDDDDFYDAVDDDEKFSFKSSLFASETASHKWVSGSRIVSSSVVSSEISLGKFPEIYSNLSENFRKFVK